MFHCRPITDSQLRKIALTCVAIMTLIQVSLIAHWWDVTQFSDYGEYGRLAYGAYNAGSWYPSRNQLYGLFIFSPGFVNWLYIQLLIFGTLAYNPVFNMLLNLGIMTCVFRIADTFFHTEPHGFPLRCIHFYIPPGGASYPWPPNCLSFFSACLEYNYHYAADGVGQ